MSRLGALLIFAALALVALGAYDVLRGGPAPVAAPVAAPAPAALELTATQTPIGTVVTSAGATLYRFDKDTAKPARSNCAGRCAATWPPLRPVRGAPQLAGVDPALVGIVVRSDGTEQVTLGGWPVYRYSGDKAPGDLRGEGVGRTWHAVAPNGKPAVGVKPSPNAAAPVAGTAPAEGQPEPAQQPKPAEVPESDSGYGGYGY